MKSPCQPLAGTVMAGAARCINESPERAPESRLDSQNEFQGTGAGRKRLDGFSSQDYNRRESREAQIEVPI